MTEVKDNIIKILRSAGRPGMEDVIAYMESSGYFTKYGGGHHKVKGGLAQHSIEVYDFMLAHNVCGFSQDSIAVAALFHDLGKVEGGRGKHWDRSVGILDRLGFALAEEERYAISHHHDKSVPSLLHPLRMALSAADMVSTGRWKREHPSRSRH